MGIGTGLPPIKHDFLVLTKHGAFKVSAVRVVNNYGITFYDNDELTPPTKPIPHSSTTVISSPVVVDKKGGVKKASRKEDKEEEYWYTPDDNSSMHVVAWFENDTVYAVIRTDCGGEL